MYICIHPKRARETAAEGGEGERGRVGDREGRGDREREREREERAERGSRGREGGEGLTCALKALKGSSCASYCEEYLVIVSLSSTALR